MSDVRPSDHRGSKRPYRVMLVDDSAVVRGLIRRSLEVDPEVEIVAAVGDGLAAIERVRKGGVEIVVLDIEMPRMDGLTALPEMLKIEPELQVIMASTLTQKNADISLKAIGMGAKDYVGKPSTGRGIVGAESFQLELLTRIKGFGAQSRRRADLSDVKPTSTPTPTPTPTRPGVADPLPFRRARKRF